MRIFQIITRRTWLTKSNQCTPTVQTSISRIRRRKGNFPNWNVIMWSKLECYQIGMLPNWNVTKLEFYQIGMLPTFANYALQRTATDKAKEYPEATKVVLENFYVYMDDYLDSVESPERALRLKGLAHRHLGEFKLKYVSNVYQIWLTELMVFAKSTEPKVIASVKEESMHVLAIKWHQNRDTGYEQGY